MLRSSVETSELSEKAEYVWCTNMGMQTDVGQVGRLLQHDVIEECDGSDEGIVFKMTLKRPKIIL